MQHRSIDEKEKFHSTLSTWKGFMESSVYEDIMDLINGRLDGYGEDYDSAELDDIKMIQAARGELKLIKEWFSVVLDELKLEGAKENDGEDH